MLRLTGTASATVLNGLTASITTIYNPGTFSGNAMAANTNSVTYVSSSVVQVSGSNLTCLSAIKGAIRYSNTSSTLEYCNSTAWTSMGPSATSPVSFRAHRASAQTVTINTFVKIDLDTEAFDKNNNFASGRFTPTVAGKYLITGSLDCNNATGGLCYVNLYKNG